MKNLISLVSIIFICVSCVSRASKQELVVEEKEEAMIQIDVIGNSQFICFAPADCTLEYVVNTPPQKSDSTILFCADASFTGQRMETFEYSNICGTYIADSRVRNKDIQPKQILDSVHKLIVSAKRYQELGGLRRMLTT